MANEKIDEVLRRAESDMKCSGRLSRGVYFDIYEQAVNGESFVAVMSPHDAFKMRALLTRHYVKGIMSSRIQDNGTMRVSFNLQ